MNQSNFIVPGKTLLIDKPLDWTSFDVVNKIRYEIKTLLNIKKIKVGHAGTLDPRATGLLLICTGKMTKRIHQFQGMEKEYTGIIRLGAKTPSYDTETEVSETNSVNHLTKDDILKEATTFLGNTEQLPPMYSAKKVNGVRGYQAARAGEVIDLKKVIVNISEFEITQVKLPDVHFRIVCSKGTYIRSVANDIGEKLGVGAHLYSLCRTRIGTYKIQEAQQLSSWISALHANN